MRVVSGFSQSHSPISLVTHYPHAPWAKSREEIWMAMAMALLESGGFV